MPGPILPISAPSAVDAIRPAGGGGGGGAAFQEVFSSAVQTVEAFGRDASASVERFLSGEGEELHTAILATERAEVAFDLFLQTRELERSVMSLAEVEQARVHLTFPKESVFLDDQQPAKASVLVRLRPGARLAPQNVLAIDHLAASAVEGLSPEAAAVVDMNGSDRTSRP